MNHSPVDPVTAIAEVDATGAVADLYADIRATLGVPVVNLIWRHLATLPGGLAWTWATLKPIYVDGTVAAEATGLNESLNFPALPGITEATLDAINLSPADRTSIATTIASYERSNARNLVAMSALIAALDQSDTPESVATSPAVDLASVIGEMPPLPAMNEMPPNVKALVEELNLLGDRVSVMPTMYRHLSHWPAYLAQLHVLIKPLHDDGRLERMIETAIAEGLQRGLKMRPNLGQPDAPLTAESTLALRESVSRFIKEPISKMTAIGGLVSRAMPSD